MVTNAKMKQEWLDALYEMYPDCKTTSQVSREQIQHVLNKHKFEKYPHFLTNPKNRISRGVFAIMGNSAAPQVAGKQTAPIHMATAPAEVIPFTKKYDPMTNVESLIPQPDPNYVPFGNYKDVEAIIKSEMFYPVYITGPSGNGKSAMIEQICAKHKRPMIRVNLTAMTDEEALIGSKTLVNGNIEVVDGPVIKAMRMGAILLLDECLSEHEEVRVGTIDNWVPVALSELELDCVYPIVSFNMESGKFENDYGSIISDREDDLYEVELEDGSTITLNAKHPFIVQQNHLYEQKSIEAGLSIGDKIVIME